MTDSSAVLPTFVVIGAMKTGTSSLASYLRAHPEVFMTTPKEPGFFSLRWDHGLEWYEELFTEAGGAPARGEASTNYTKAPSLPGVPARMASVIPDARLVYVVRDPLPRVRSHYIHNCAHRGERRPVDVAVREDPDYLDFSRYGYQLQLFLEHYRRDQILVVSSERLRSHRRDVLREVFDFVGVDPHAEIENVDEELNRGRDKRRTPVWIEEARVWANRLHIAQRFPLSWRERAWKATQVGRISARMSEPTKQWVLGELRSDLEAFYEIAGGDFPRWATER